MEQQSIAIDGPAGAGKSTLARSLAQRLNYVYVDTGAIYRTVALFVQRMGLDLSNEEELSRLLSSMNLRIGYGEDGLQHMYQGKEDVTEFIRTGEISRLSSQVAALPGVRKFLLEVQRTQANLHNVVMDGRDIGTVVLPQAGVKIFLTASPEVRARRRLQELRAKGEPAVYQDVLKALQTRDLQDETRAISPLVPAEEALLLDTTEMGQEESLQAIERIVKERILL